MLRSNSYHSLAQNATKPQNHQPSTGVSSLVRPQVSNPNVPLLECSVLKCSTRLQIWNNRHLRIFSNRIEWGCISAGQFVEKQNEKSPISLIRLIDFYQTKGLDHGAYVISICVKEKSSSFVRTIEFKCLNYRDMMDILAILNELKYARDSVGLRLATCLDHCDEEGLASAIAAAQTYRISTLDRVYFRNRDVVIHLKDAIHLYSVMKKNGHEKRKQLEADLLVALESCDVGLLDRCIKEGKTLNVDVSEAEAILRALQSNEPANRQEDRQDECRDFFKDEESDVSLLEMPLTPMNPFDEFCDPPPVCAALEQCFTDQKFSSSERQKQSGPSTSLVCYNPASTMIGQYNWLCSAETKDVFRELFEDAVKQPPHDKKKTFESEESDESDDEEFPVTTDEEEDEDESKVFPVALFHESFEQAEEQEEEVMPDLMLSSSLFKVEEEKEEDEEYEETSVTLVLPEVELKFQLILLELLRKDQRNLQKIMLRELVDEKASNVVVAEVDNKLEKQVESNDEGVEVMKDEAKKIISHKQVKQAKSSVKVRGKVEVIQERLNELSKLDVEAGGDGTLGRYMPTGHRLEPQVRQERNFTV